LGDTASVALTACGRQSLSEYVNGQGIRPAEELGGWRQKGVASCAGGDVTQHAFRANAGEWGIMHLASEHGG